MGQHWYLHSDTDHNNNSANRQHLYRFIITLRLMHQSPINAWASCQIRKIAGCACARNAGNVFPATARKRSDMHNGTWVTHVPRCMPGSLTCGFLWSRWRGKRSRHSQRMRNPQFCLSGERPIDGRMRQGPTGYLLWSLLLMIAMIPKSQSLTIGKRLLPSKTYCV